jgi:hypothetical protein
MFAWDVNPVGFRWFFGDPSTDLVRTPGNRFGSWEPSRHGQHGPDDGGRFCRLRNLPNLSE